jgi:hypothetical protein
MNTNVLGMTCILLVCFLIYYSHFKEDFNENSHHESNFFSQSDINSILKKHKQYQANNARFKNNEDYRKTINFKGKTTIKQLDGTFKKTDSVVTNPPIKQLHDSDFKTESITTKLQSTVEGERKKQLITDKQWEILKRFKIDDLFQILSNLTQMPKSDIDQNKKPDFLELISLIESIITQKTDKESLDYSNNTSSKTSLIDLLYPLLDKSNILTESASNILKNQTDKCKNNKEDCNYGWSYAPPDTWQTHVKKPPKCVVDKSDLQHIRDPIAATWAGEFKEWNECDKKADSILPEWTPGTEDYPKQPEDPNIRLNNTDNKNNSISSLGAAFNSPNNVDNYARQHRLKTYMGERDLQSGIYSNMNYDGDMSALNDIYKTSDKLEIKRNPFPTRTNK